MIKTFATKETAAVFDGRNVRKYSSDLQSSACRKLIQLDLAQNIEDMRNPPGNRLERLSGGLNGKYSIRINRQWRVCFEWRDGDAFEVEIRDYH